MESYRDCYDKGRERLKACDVPEADTDAVLLLEYVMGTDRNTLYSHPEMEVDEETAKEYYSLIEKRGQRIPLQHITHSAPFMGLEFKVTPDTLIPRPDTETLTEEAMRVMMDGMKILDMCTGSGCILISLLHYSNGCKGVGCDISGAALSVAKENAFAILGENSDISFREGNMFETLNEDEKFDIIVSNPPYILGKDIEGLMPEVKDHDPYNALFGGDDGLDFYRIIAREAPKHLYSDGMLLVEIGYNQGSDVKALFEKEGLKEVTVIKDFGNNDRVVSARYIADRKQV
ncbi:MAG: peptide chain release factor N(5)-glutamine methyltransferase [Lachnospiraceae bacterium]|nr:peptide chain release factor N(5)-glutamine methyltransferase [Lachnospiraceae bacterium]